MTDIQMIEGNRTIAIFMGAKLGRIDIAIKYPEKIPGWAYQLNDFDMLKVGGYEYHTSWDWLMPVVEKCRMIRNEANGVGDYQWRLGLLYDQINVSVWSLDITALWISCEKFIKHYNSCQP